MKDDVRQITNVVQLNQNVLVEGLLQGNTLRPHGVKYSFEETTKTSKDTTLKVALHPEVEEQLDDEKDEPLGCSLLTGHRFQRTWPSATMSKVDSQVASFQESERTVPPTRQK